MDFFTLAEWGTWFCILGTVCGLLWLAFGEMRPEKAQQRERREQEKEYEGRGFDGTEILERIQDLRASPDASAYRKRDLSKPPKAPIATREAIANASFFRRRRKVEEGEAGK